MDHDTLDNFNSFFINHYLCQSSFTRTFDRLIFIWIFSRFFIDNYLVLGRSRADFRISRLSGFWKPRKRGKQRGMFLIPRCQLVRIKLNYDPDSVLQDVLHLHKYNSSFYGHQQLLLKDGRGKHRTIGIIMSLLSAESRQCIGLEILQVRKLVTMSVNALR